MWGQLSPGRSVVEVQPAFLHAGNRSRLASIYRAPLTTYISARLFISPFPQVPRGAQTGGMCIWGHVCAPVYTCVHTCIHVPLCARVHAQMGRSS